MEVSGQWNSVDHVSLVPSLSMWSLWIIWRLWAQSMIVLWFQVSVQTLTLLKLQYQIKLYFSWEWALWLSIQQCNVLGLHVQLTACCLRITETCVCFSGRNTKCSCSSFRPKCFSFQSNEASCTGSPLETQIKALSCLITFQWASVTCYFSLKKYVSLLRALNEMHRH